jgi:hypothetical protein
MALNPTSGQLARIPFADSIGAARQFHVGARLAFLGQGSGPRISDCGSKKCTPDQNPNRRGRKKRRINSLARDGKFV